MPRRFVSFAPTFLRIKRLTRYVAAHAAIAFLAVLVTIGTTISARAEPVLTNKGAAERPRVMIALLDAFPPAFYIDTYVPLVEHLRAALPELEFITSESTPANAASPRAYSPNTFFILSSGDVVLHQDWGLNVIGARRSLSTGVNAAAGAAFIVRSESPFRRLADLEGRIAAVASSEGFEDRLIPMGEIAAEGFRPEDFFRETLVTEWNYPDVPMLVKLGHADVGILPLCALEEAQADGRIREGDFRVIAEKTTSADACRRSTSLYPGTLVAAAPGANPDIVKAVTIALLSMPAQDGYDWVANADLSSVNDLLHTLALGPYAYLRDWSAAGIWRRYQLEICLLFALMAAVAIHIARTNLLVHRRTEELRHEARLREEAAEALEESREQLARMERAGMASMLSAMFAHEIKQPLTNVINFITGARMLARRRAEANAADLAEIDARASKALESAVNEAYRAAAIVDRVRAAAKRHAPVYESVALQAVIREAIKHSRAERYEDRVGLVLPEKPVVVRCDSLQIQLVLVNFLNNAVDALSRLTTDSRASPRSAANRDKTWSQETDDAQASSKVGVRAVRLRPDARIDVVLTSDSAAGEARVSVIDNGPVVPDDVFKALGNLTESRKPEGLGFGLAIASSIAEAHGGRVFFHRCNPHGLCAVLSLPLALESAASQEPSDDDVC